MNKVISILVYSALFFTLSPVSAEICIPETSGNQCTAGDFTLTEQVLSGPPSCTAGELIDITLRVGMTPTSNERYDIGIFVGDSGNSPIGGASCTFESLTPLEPLFDGLSGTGPYRDLDGNSCGDTLNSDGEIFRDIVLKDVLCQDNDGGGELDVAYALTWKQSVGECAAADDPNEFIRTASKCSQWVANIDVEVVPPPPLVPSIDVTKTAVPNVIHPGDEVVYTISVLNDGPVTITLTSLNDDIYGDLNGQGSCLTPQTVDAGDTYSCSFAENPTGDAPSTHTNTVTASGTDGTTPVEDNDSAAVAIIDSNDAAIGYLVWLDLNADGSWQQGEPGVDGVTLDLKNSSGTVIKTATTENSGQYLFKGLSAGKYQVVVTDDAGRLNGMILTAGVDPHNVLLEVGQTYMEANFGYAKASISVSKQASPSVIHAPGANVTYTIAVANKGPIPVELTQLHDNPFGDLTSLGGDCSIPQVIAVDGVYKCTFTESITGSAGDTHKNTTTAVANDLHGHLLFDADSEIVHIIDGSNAAIGDLVWFDSNSNGIHDAGEPGIDGVTVDLISSSGTVTTTTQNSGEYNFVDLPAGDYQVVVTDTNHQLQGLILTAGPEPHPVTLAPAQIYDLADFGYAREPLPKIAVYKVADPSVIHAPGANVTYHVGVKNVGQTVVSLDALIDDRFGNLHGKGDCSVPQEIPIGDIYICSFVEHISGDPGDVHRNTVGGIAKDSNDHYAHDTASAEVVIIDGSSSAIGDLVWHDIDSDGVIDVGEPGIGNVTLDLLQGSSVIASTTTNSEGDYSFNNLSAGSYLVRVTDTHGELAGTILTGGPEPHPVTLEAAQIYDLADFGYAREPLPVIAVYKVADPTVIHAPGADVTYHVAVKNIGPTDVTLYDLTDNPFGDLDGKGTCSVPQKIIVGDIYVCSFVEEITGSPGDSHTNTVEGIAKDGNGHDAHDTASAEVIIIDSNTGAIGNLVWHDIDADGIIDDGEPGIDNVTLDLLQGSSVIKTATTNNGGSYSFNGLSAGAYQVKVTDTHGVLAGTVLTGGTDPHAVDLGAAEIYDLADFGYAKAEITVLKRANPSVIHTPGDTVTYTIAVANTGPIEVTLEELVDTRFGDLDGQGTCRVPQTLSVKAVYACSFTKEISGSAGDTHKNTVVGAANDGHGNKVLDADDEVVYIIDGSNAAIGDLVWFDSNYNGVPDAGEPGIDGVTVQLRQDTTADGVYDFVVGTETTLNSGEYNFVDLSAGDYQVVVTDTNNQLQGLILTGGTEPHPVTLAAAEIYSLADFGYAREPLPEIAVYKVADPTVIHAPGANVTYHVGVKNIGQTDVTLNVLIDDQFGNLDGQGNCSVPQKIVMGDIYICSFVKHISGDPGDVHRNTVGGIAKDSNDHYAYDTGSAEVIIVDSNSGAIGNLVWHDIDADGVFDIGEPGIGNVTLALMQGSSVVATTTTNNEGIYGFNNLSAGSYQVTVTDTHGVLTGALLTGGTDPHAVDLGAGEIYDLADFGYAKALIKVLKHGDPSSIHPPSGEVEYTVAVLNIGFVDVTVTELNDDKFGDLNGQGDCQLPQFIPARTSYACSFSKIISGDAGDQHTNVVTAKAVDREDNEVIDDADFTVIIVDSNDAAIGDLVWNDENGNGIRELSEPGIGLVTVELKLDSDKNGSYETAVDTKTTQANGHYLFSGLSAGNYRVSVTDMHGIVSGMTLTGGTDPHLVPLSVGELYLDADFGYYRKPVLPPVEPPEPPQPPAPAKPVPTLSEWSLILLFALMAIVFLIETKRVKREAEFK